MTKQPKAWMRKWAFDGEVPKKELNENKRWAYPKKYLFKEVTTNKVFKDDVPLYSDEKTEVMKVVASKDVIAMAKLFESGKLTPNNTSGWESVVECYEFMVEV